MVFNHFHQPPLIFDSIFDDFIKKIPASQRIPVSGFPVVDSYHDEDGNAILEFALAGYKAEDLNVSVEGSKVIVSSEGATTTDPPVPSSRRIAKRKFSNTFSDHDNIFDLQSLTVLFEDGILRVFIPKQESAKPKVFEIMTSQKSLG